ncbi:FAD-dependent oxidoreductase [Glaciimonas sp. PCH181]|uniref:FAD-dependent oxidoreductase n=1 Tax=Glaciimonas sp. PCH181 TaxID=2133943 RepID=UPI000D3D7C66|nr:FAD-dependent oxidoreductase [Glaciimonas sp. PCH181]PUA19167.1 2-polyprenyl-6-methoxyphenol hydroxylase [Glaciimonas sp. PCH181]
MSKVKKVLVVGGGIGGLTAAIAFARKGVDVDIVEIKTEWTVYGVGIIQPSNALRALHQLGLAEECIARGFAFPGWRLFDSQGVAIADVPNLNTAAPQFLPNNGIGRRVLHDILVEAAARGGAKVRLGLSVETLDSDDDGVTVKMTDGGVARYDLVVGADGVYSKVRSLLFGNQHTPVFTGQAVWRYNFPRPKDMKWASIWYGKKTKAGLVPMSEDTMYVFLVTSEPGNPWLPENQLHTLLRERLAEYGGLVAELATQVVSPKEVVYKPIESLIVPQPWHKGRVVLIGDAVHATVPHLAQGASIAIEDAVLLAEMLTTDASVEDALTAFTQRRYARCKFVVDSSHKLGLWELQEWAGHPSPEADFAGLMQHAWDKLNEPT